MECGEFGYEGKRSEQVKYALQRLQPLIKRSLKVLQIDIDRLEKHRKNIQRFRSIGELSALSKEQKNANTTVEQINSQIMQLENVRSQVIENDINIFDEEVKSIYQEARCLTQNFLKENMQLPNYVHDTKPFCIHSCPGSPLSCSIPEEFPLSLQDEQIMTETAQHSWEDLQLSLEDLNKLIHDYSSVVQDQQEPIDVIESNIEEACIDVQEGSKNLIKASRIKSVAYPVAGMLIGGALGGPVGLVAGLKIGAAACLGGSVLGFTSGRFIKKKQDTNVKVIESNLAKNNSKSVPELYVSDMNIVTDITYDLDSPSSVT